MTFFQKLAALGGLAVVIFALNLIAQKVLPTKTSDPHGQKIAFNGLVYFLFVGALGLVVLIGFALSR